MPEEKQEPQEKNEIIEFADKKETDFSSIVVWLSFVIALLFMGFIWFSNNSLKNSIDDKKNQEAEAKATISLPENQKVVDDVTGLKSVISILSDVSTTQESKKVSLDNLYSHFTKDVHITTISLSDDGTTGVDGVTASYRTAADFMLGLKSYSRVSGLELKTISLSTDAKVDQSMKVSFSVSFKLDMTKAPAATAQAPADSSSVDATTNTDGTTSTDSTSVPGASDITPIDPSSVTTP